MKKKSKQDKSCLPPGTTLLVGLRANPVMRQCVPVEVRIVDGKVTESALIHDDAEDVSDALHRAMNRLHEIWERATAEAWPPDMAEYPLSGAAERDLMDPVTVVGKDGVLLAFDRDDVLNVPPGVIPEWAEARLAKALPLWAESVYPVMKPGAKVELAETLNYWVLRAISDGSEISSIKVRKDSEDD